jgi:hypothetical protein
VLVEKAGNKAIDRRVIFTFQYHAQEHHVPTPSGSIPYSGSLHSPSDIDTAQNVLLISDVRIVVFRVARNAHKLHFTISFRIFHSIEIISPVPTIQTGPLDSESIPLPA